MSKKNPYKKEISLHSYLVIRCVACKNAWLYGAEHLTEKEKENWVCPSCSEIPKIIQVDISEYNKVNYYVNLGYRERIEIIKEGNEIVVNRDFCVPEDEDNVGSDFQELIRFKI